MDPVIAPFLLGVFAGVMGTGIAWRIHWEKEHGYDGWP
jgi:hypothetical protein